MDYEDLRRTAIVAIRAASMDDRPAPHGGVPAAAFSERASKWWKVAPYKQARVERLIAVLTGSGGVILGDWDVEAGGDYGPDGDVFPLVDPEADDPRGVKGMRLVGERANSSRVYSRDLRG